MPITVTLGERSYPIVLGTSYKQLPALLKPLSLSRHGWIISHASILRQYGPPLRHALKDAGWTLTTLTIPESEASKSMATVERIIQRISARPLLHVPVLFAFGGGVVGDVTGFVAAILRRGVPYIQLPTTLLAQVDSAIGGKVGVDLPEGKNLLGAFYQPRLVLNHLAVLSSLPIRQRRSGLAEVIKYGVIADRTLFDFLAQRMAACVSLQPQAVRVMVERSCAVKARIVSQDEREHTGLRATLNFGHTLGHALEAATNYTRWTHGEAIAIGMCAAGRLSVELGWWSAAELVRLVRVIQAAGLPTMARGVGRERVLRAMQYDKKFTHGRPRWVLPQRIGRVVVTEAVPASAVRRVLLDYVKPA